jgi:carbamoyl-phosphate synthase large subunit
MPKRTDIKSILVIGAGPIIIGQACEFDYSGTQACKALKEEGYRVILVNSNPATIMTDPEIADATYIEPVTPEFIAKIIALEKPDAILPTVGGQTALNCALKLADMGVLDEYNVELIGAKREAIEKAENRQLFKEAMARINLECPKNVVVHSLEEALESLDYVGLPAIIRPSFTLGGQGGGIANNKEEYIEIVKSGLDASPNNEILIDESIIGWKEYEMEAIRDMNDNCIIICSIENIDPMGVHTGDSITVAPALTLTDKEYQIMRNATIAVLREIGVDTGGSNVQFAVNPKDGRILVIEMNPRVSRSSALASKATGYPIAKVAAKLAVGYFLDEIINDCTKATPASFEPVIDYIVTKIPRFTFEKFSSTKKTLSSSMKSVGEAMAIGRSFKESLQKALRSLEIGLNGLSPFMPDATIDELKQALTILHPERLLIIADAIRKNIDLAEIHRLTSYDFWFLEQIKEIIDVEKELINNGLKEEYHELLELKKQGFGDNRIAELTNKTEEDVRKIRHDLNVRPVFKRIDTCASEFESVTSYMYSCYEGDGYNIAECESNISDKKKVVIIGSGPNRIGQGIEFDYACVHAAYAIHDAGFETIMINCNPETVSTDYDTSDRLYFEPLTTEDVLEVIKKEQSSGNLLGVNVQFGGQTPLKLSHELLKNNIPIIGTQPDAIDIAEDRERFKQLLDKLNLKQPKNATCISVAEIKEAVNNIGYPIVVRPSYVLGGRAMDIIHDDSALEEYLIKNGHFLANGPLLIDSYLNDAIELDVDALGDGKDVIVAGIMEHVEEAGVHSGDSACILPPQNLSAKIIEEIKASSIKIAKELKVIGLINIQYAVQNETLYIIEVNPRASRTVPFVAKATGVSVAKIASLLMIGKTLKELNITSQMFELKNYVAVKEAVFPFERFENADVILGPEMKSTGEVMGIDTNFARAYAKAQIASGDKLPLQGTVFISVKDSDKKDIITIARELSALDFSIVATKGTAKFLNDNGIAALPVNKVREGEPHIVSMIKSKTIDLVINTTEGKQSIADSFSIRRTALMSRVNYSTNITSAKALILAIKGIKLDKSLAVRSIQSYISGLK